MLPSAFECFHGRTVCYRPHLNVTMVKPHVTIFYLKRSWIPRIAYDKKQNITRKFNCGNKT